MLSLPAGKAIWLANVLKNKLVKDSKDFKWYLMKATLEWNWWDGSGSGKKWWWSIMYEVGCLAKVEKRVFPTTWLS